MAKAQKVKIPKHIHKYQRQNLTRNPDKAPFLVMACMQPACTHYIAKHLALGKLCECHICGDPFIIDKVSIDHARPHCNDCIKKKVRPEIDALAKLAEGI